MMSILITLVLLAHSLALPISTISISAHSDTPSNATGLHESIPNTEQLQKRVDKWQPSPERGQEIRSNLHNGDLYLNLILATPATTSNAAALAGLPFPDHNIFGKNWPSLKTQGVTYTERQPSSELLTGLSLLLQESCPTAFPGNIQASENDNYLEYELSVNGDTFNVMAEVKDRTLIMLDATVPRTPAPQVRANPNSYFNLLESTLLAIAWRSSTKERIYKRLAGLTRYSEPSIDTLSTDTIRMIEAVDCHIIQDTEKAPVQNWGLPQKCEFPAGSNEFLTLLGTSRGRVLAELLIYHKAAFGHIIPTSVKIFESQSYPQPRQYGLSWVLEKHSPQKEQAIRANIVQLPPAAAAGGQAAGQAGGGQAGGDQVGGGQAVAGPSH